MMPLPWLKQVSVSYRCWRYWPFIFLVSDRYQILRYRNTAIPPLYIVRAHTVRTLMERTKLQSRTNRELVGIRGLLSLNSEHSNRPSVICQITGWWMVPPRWCTREVKPLMWDSHRVSLFSAIWLVLCFPVGHRRQSDKPAQPRHGLPRSVMEVRDDTQRPVWVAVSDERPSFKASFSCVSQHRRRQDAGERHHAAKWVWDVWF